MTANTKYGFYLGDGSYLEYDLSPNSCLTYIIKDLTSAYWKIVASDCYLKDIWMLPKYAAILRAEIAPHSLIGIAGCDVLFFTTCCGPMRVLTNPRLSVPIFIGSEDEMKDNNFNAEMDKILAH